jgi:hypothetical protein
VGSKDDHQEAGVIDIVEGVGCGEDRYCWSGLRRGQKGVERPGDDDGGADCSCGRAGMMSRIECEGEVRVQ